VARQSAGYQMDLTGHDVDVQRFTWLADEGEALLVGGRPAEARDRFEEALALWRGPALLDLVDRGHGVARAASLEERRLSVLERRLVADLDLGRHALVVGELQALVDEHPLRERMQELLALALYRSGRQADALRALATAGELLREELGLEPSRELRDLEARILSQDPTLDPPASPTPAPSGAGAARPAAAAGVAAAVVTERSSGLFGRDDDLAELRAALAEAADDARFLVVEGEPGIGKTRLVDELATLAAAEGSVVAWGRSDESGAAPALWPWLPVLRAVVAADEGAPDLLAEVLDGGAPSSPARARPSSSSASTPSPPCWRPPAPGVPWWCCSTTCSGPTPPRWSCSSSSPPACRRGCWWWPPCAPSRWATPAPSPTRSPRSPAVPEAGVSVCGASTRPPPGPCWRRWRRRPSSPTSPPASTTAPRATPST